MRRPGRGASRPPACRVVNRANLSVKRSAEGKVIRLDLEVEGQPNLAITWSVESGLQCFVEGTLRSEDLGGAHPVARVAELVPVKAPIQVIRAAVESLRLDPPWEREVLRLLIGNLESKSAR